MDLVKKWGWKSFTIIYESNDGLVRLQELLKARNAALAAYPITIRQLGSGRDHRWLFLDLTELNLRRRSAKPILTINIDIDILSVRFSCQYITQRLYNSLFFFILQETVTWQKLFWEAIFSETFWGGSLAFDNNSGLTKINFFLVKCHY